MGALELHAAAERYNIRINLWMATGERLFFGAAQNASVLYVYVTNQHMVPLLLHSGTRWSDETLPDRDWHDMANNHLT